jgi:hypothetical protein
MMSQASNPIHKMTQILATAGRTRQGQKLVRSACTCGNTFIAREDNVKSGRTVRCENCRKKPAKKPVSNPVPEVTSTFERGTPAYYADEIARKESALISNENHIRFLELEIAKQDATDLDTLKKRKAEATSANDLRQEISRLQIQKAKAETATVKDTKSARELMRERITALRGEK